MTEKNLPWYAREDGEGFRLAEEAAHAALMRQGEDVLILDLRGRSDVADYFVIATGQVDIQVDAISRGVLDDLLSGGHKPLHDEGRDRFNWVLLDYVDVVVHVMQPKSRDHYRLDQLWNDAGRLEVDVAYFARPEVAARHPELALVKRGAEEES